MAKHEDMSGIPEKPRGLYIYDRRTGPLIILDNQLKTSPRLHKCVLAEEIGHFYTVPRISILKAYTSTNQRIIQCQDELKALKWATDFLIPDTELIKALKAGSQTRYELAEWFDVTEDFICQKLAILSLNAY